MSRATLFCATLLLAAAAHAAVRFDERFEFAPGFPQSGGNHGIATAVDGDVAVAGAYFEDLGRGAVYVYERQRGGFAFRQRLVANDRQPNDRFGLHVDVDGSTIAVGAIGADGNIGAVYIFTRDTAGNWVQAQRIVGARTDGGAAREAGDEFGVVALDGDDLVVGAPGTDYVGIILSDPKGAAPKGNVADTGAVYHFVRGGNGLYTQRDMVFEFGASGSNRFGESVDVERNRLVAGALNGDGAVANSGNAWVYTRSSPASSYFQALGQELFANDGTATDQFVNVRISGNTILAGARQEDVAGPAGSNHGAAYVFQFNGASFVQAQKLVAQFPGSNDYYGNGVAIDGDVLMVGAPYGFSGFVEMWERVAGTWVRAPNRLTARSTIAGDFLGASIGLSGNAAVFGAFGRDLAQADAGVLHVFERDEASRLTRQRRFTTSIASEGDRGRFDLLGSSVAISPRWLVAGAPGVLRFDAFSLSFVRTGAAYVFDRTSTAAPAVLSAMLEHDDRFGHAVAITRDGRTVVVGASEAGSGNPGEVYVYTQPGGGWTGTLSAPAPVAITVACGFRDGFARSVAIGDDGLILVGSSLNTYGALPSVGAAYVLRPNGAGYDQFCIQAPSLGVSGQFGAEVAVEGRHLYIGAPEESRVYHYEMLASGPVLRHTLAGQAVSSGPVVAEAKGVIGNKFGTGIAAEGDIIVVGAPLADTSAGVDAGMAYVYELSGTTIDATAELIGDKFGPGANAGASVATNGEVIVLGAPLADPGGVADAGGAYAYEKPPGGWLGTLIEAGALDPPEPNAGGQFGYDAAATDDAVAIGEPYDDGPTIDGVPADDQGSAFAFDFAEFMLFDGFE